MQKLSSQQLYRFTNLAQTDFDPKDTKGKDAEILDFMQHFHPRAYQSLNFGLHMKRNHNHIFIMGEPGIGRIGMTKAMLTKSAQQKPIPDDVVLVSDFSEANKTQYLYFEAGVGIEFKTSVESFVTQLKTHLPIHDHIFQTRGAWRRRHL